MWRPECGEGSAGMKCVEYGINDVLRIGQGVGRHGAEPALPGDVGEADQRLA